MTVNGARRRTRPRLFGAVIASVLVVATASVGAANAAANRSVTRPNDGLGALHFLVANPIDRDAIGDRTTGL